MGKRLVKDPPLITFELFNNRIDELIGMGMTEDDAIEKATDEMSSGTLDPDDEINKIIMECGPAYYTFLSQLEEIANEKN